MSNHSKNPDRALVMVGLGSVVLAILGLWYNSTTLFADYTAVIDDLKNENDLSHFYRALYAMSAICVVFYVGLFISGIQLIRKKVIWVFVLSGVIALEIGYFLLVGWFWTNSTYGYSIAAATGVSNGGLMYQVFSLFPIWAPATALWARRKKLLDNVISNYAFEADAVRQRTVSCRVPAPRGSTRRYALMRLQ